MIFDKTLLSADGLTVAKTASGTTAGKVLDLRLNGDIGQDGAIKLYAQIVGAKNTAGSITTVVQTSDNGSTWEDVVSAPQRGNRLLAMMLPYGLKRYVRLEFVVGSTALDTDVKVMGGLVDEFDSEGFPKVQSYPPMQDLAAQGDAVVAGT